MPGRCGNRAALFATRLNKPKWTLVNMTIRHNGSGPKGKRVFPKVLHAFKN